MMSELAPDLFSKISERYFGRYTSHFSDDWESKWAAEQLQLSRAEEILAAAHSRGMALEGELKTVQERILKARGIHGETDQA
jgi:hypothetical protein